MFDCTTPVPSYLSNTTGTLQLKLPKHCNVRTFVTSYLVHKDARSAVFQVTNLLCKVLSSQFVVPYLVLVAEALHISRVALIPPNQRQRQPFVAQTAVASATYILEHRQQFQDLAGLYDGLRILQAFPY